MSEQRHAALAIHPIAVDEDGENHELPKRRQIVRRTRIVVLIDVRQAGCCVRSIEPEGVVDGLCRRQTAACHVAPDVLPERDLPNG